MKEIKYIAVAAYKGVLYVLIVATACITTRCNLHTAMFFYVFSV